MGFMDVDSDSITFKDVSSDVMIDIVNQLVQKFGVKIAHTTGNNDTDEFVCAFEASIPEDRCDEVEEFVSSLHKKYKLGY